MSKWFKWLRSLNLLLFVSHRHEEMRSTGSGTEVRHENMDCEAKIIQVHVAHVVTYKNNQKHVELLTRVVELTNKLGERSSGLDEQTWWQHQMGENKIVISCQMFLVVKCLFSFIFHVFVRFFVCFCSHWCLPVFTRLPVYPSWNPALDVLPQGSRLDTTMRSVVEDAEDKERNSQS